MKKIAVEVDEQEGRISYLHDEVVLSSAGMFAYLQEELSKADPLLAKRLLYISGEESAKEAVSEAQKLFIRVAGGKLKRTLALNMMNLGLERGFGLFSPEDDFNFESGEGMVVVENSVVARHAKKSASAVCYHVAGVISGAAEILWDSPFTCHEVLCAAKGDPKCFFNLTRCSKAQKKEFLRTMNPF